MAILVSVPFLVSVFLICIELQSTCTALLAGFLVCLCYAIQYGETDLLFACKENDLRIVKKILSKGADPNIPNMVGCFFVNKDIQWNLLTRGTMGLTILSL